MWLEFWLAWGGIFVIGEGVALFNKTNGDTLSETVWAWLRGREKGPKARTIRNTSGLAAVVVEKPRKITWSHNTWRTWVVGAFLLWLFFHLTFGWFAG